MAKKHDKNHLASRRVERGDNAPAVIITDHIPADTESINTTPYINNNSYNGGQSKYFHLGDNVDGEQVIIRVPAFPKNRRGNDGERLLDGLELASPEYSAQQIHNSDVYEAYRRAKRRHQRK